MNVLEKTRTRREEPEVLDAAALAAIDKAGGAIAAIPGYGALIVRTCGAGGHERTCPSAIN